MRGLTARTMRRGLFASLLVTVPALAGQPAVTVRGGEHADFSRVVFTLPPGITARSLQLGALLVLTFPKAGKVPGLAPAPARLLSVSGGLNQAALGVPDGVRTHVWQIDHRVIVDVFAGAQPQP
jgi:hypothetical protein